MTKDEIVDTLNDLIQITEDSHEGYRKSAEDAEEQDLKSLFNDLSAQRGAMVRDLQKHVAEQGGAPEASGTILGGAHRFFVGLKSSVHGARPDGHPPGNRAGRERGYPPLRTGSRQGPSGPSGRRDQPASRAAAVRPRPCRCDEQGIRVDFRIVMEQKTNDLKHSSCRELDLDMTVRGRSTESEAPDGVTFPAAPPPAASTARFSAGDLPLQSVISSMVRRHPRQSFDTGSITQTRVQGDGTVSFSGHRQAGDLCAAAIIRSASASPLR